MPPDPFAVTKVEMELGVDALVSEEVKIQPSARVKL